MPERTHHTRLDELAPGTWFMSRNVVHGVRRGRVVGPGLDGFSVAVELEAPGRRRLIEQAWAGAIMVELEEPTP